MGTEQKIGPGPHRFTQLTREGLREFQPVLGWLPRIKGSVGTRGIEFHGREALAHIFRGALGREIGVGVNPLSGIAVLRVEISVAAQPFMNLAAEQHVDRLLQRLADDVPAGSLEVRHDREQRDFRRML